MAISAADVTMNFGNALVTFFLRVSRRTRPYSSYPTPSSGREASSPSEPSDARVNIACRTAPRLFASRSALRLTGSHTRSAYVLVDDSEPARDEEDDATRTVGNDVGGRAIAIGAATTFSLEPNNIALQKSSLARARVARAIPRLRRPIAPRNAMKPR
eukprot:26869-Pelagococcus_subviridis.AAC.3